MEKYIDLSTGKPVTFGNTVTKTIKKKFPFGGEYTEKTQVMITKETVDFLIKNKFIKKEEPVKPDKIEPRTDVTYYLDKLAKKYGTSTDEINSFLLCTDKFCLEAVNTLLCKVISEEFLKVRGINLDTYKGPLYCYDSAVGEVISLPKHHTHLRNLAVFTDPVDTFRVSNILGNWAVYNMH